MTQEEIKTILAGFLKIPAGQINTATLVNRSAVGNSILLHRMYAKLGAAGFEVKNYMEVNTFGDLFRQLDGTANIEKEQPFPGSGRPAVEMPPAALPANTDSDSSIGIDIEMISSMPFADDFREDNFYSMNFSATEISWCILQPNPYASFAGLFAAKEAIVKAANQFRAMEFRNIVIQHLASGKPFYPGFNLSISHTAETAVAIAMPVLQYRVSTTEMVKPARRQEKASMGPWLMIIISLVLSIITLLMIAIRK